MFIIASIIFYFFTVFIYIWNNNWAKSINVALSCNNSRLGNKHFFKFNFNIFNLFLCTYLKYKYTVYTDL